MKDPGQIKQRYRQFADMECEGYSGVYYGLAVAVSEVDDLPALLAEAPADAELVVFHSAVLNYVAPERRQAFADALARASRQRELVWLSNEASGVIPEVAALAPSLGPERRFLLGRVQFSNGRRRGELLAFAHPHGAELTWR